MTNPISNSSSNQPPSATPGNPNQAVATRVAAIGIQAIAATATNTPAAPTNNTMNTPSVLFPHLLVQQAFNHNPNAAIARRQPPQNLPLRQPNGALPRSNPQQPPLSARTLFVPEQSTSSSGPCKSS